MENINQLVEDVLNSFNEYVSKVPNGISQIIKNLRNGNTDVAMELILQLIEGIQWLNEVNLLLEQNDSPIKMDKDILNKFLVEINEGLELNDINLVSDVLEYEMKPFFETLVNNEKVM